MKGVFITATDTGVGKTIVAAGLLRAARSGGLDVAPFKPVQTGCESGPDGLIAPDIEFALTAADFTPGPGEADLLCPYRFAPACSPHLAGRMAGQAAGIEPILHAARQLQAAHQGLIAEGAGGVLAPLNEEQTMLDVMSALAMPVVLVGRGSLGTINHTLLSLQVLRSAGLEVLGVVLSDSSAGPGDFVRADNPSAIAQFGRVEILGEIPFVDGLAQPAPPESAWRAFEESLPGLAKMLEALK